jgi:thymidylate synthase
MLSAGSASELFIQACEAVLSIGLEVAPRDIATVEVLGAHLCLTDPGGGWWTCRRCEC